MTLQRQLITFLFVGGLNTLFGYSWYALFIFLGLPYLYASLLASSLSLLFNFKMTGTFVFGSKNNAGFLKFIGVFVIASTVSTLGVTFMTHVTSNLYLAGFVAIFPAAATSFTLNKFITFKSRASATIPIATSRDLFAGSSAVADDRLCGQGQLSARHDRT